MGIDYAQGFLRHRPMELDPRIGRFPARLVHDCDPVGLEFLQRIVKGAPSKMTVGCGITKAYAITRRRRFSMRPSSGLLLQTVNLVGSLTAFEGYLLSGSSASEGSKF
jgi:hypothetical protein